MSNCPRLHASYAGVAGKSDGVEEGTGSDAGLPPGKVDCNSFDFIGIVGIVRAFT